MVVVVVVVAAVVVRASVGGLGAARMCSAWVRTLSGVRLASWSLRAAAYLFGA